MELVQIVQRVSHGTYCTCMAVRRTDGSCTWTPCHGVIGTMLSPHDGGTTMAIRRAAIRLCDARNVFGAGKGVRSSLVCELNAR